MDAFEGANARRYVRNTLVFTLMISIIANITETTLAVSEISLWLRVPGAAVWPILAFCAIEILVRMLWERRFSHYLTRSLILIPGIPAVIVSYEHQRALLVSMGETGIVPFIGPIAIDGLMIGCTLALLVTRRPIELPEVPEVEIVAEAEAIVRRAPRPRPARNTGALSVALDALYGGAEVKDAAAKAGMGVSTVRKYAAVMRKLRENPHADIDATGLRQDVIDDIRAHAREWASR
jgi:hypothetical protein